MKMRWMVAWAGALLLLSPLNLSAQEGIAPDPAVLAIDLPAPSDPTLRRAAARVYRAACGQARYLLSTVHPWKRHPELELLTASRSGEHWIRPNTSAAEGFAFLVRFGPFDEQQMGISRAQLLGNVLVPMLRYLVATHRTGRLKTGDGQPWGDAWQSAHWAYSLGRAAWYTWERLPADLRSGVRRVIAHEAGRFLDARPPHRVRADTKAEENAWNSTVLSSAILLMPADPRRPRWEAAFQRWALSAFLRPADEHSPQIVDGRPLAECFSGANIHDDFTLENHGMVHPDYMSTFSLSMGCLADYALTRRTPPEALRHNAAGLYENLKWFTLPAGGFVYPMGQDWRLYRNADWLYTHVLMATFGRDPDAWELATHCLATIEKMQARSSSGAIYAPGEYFFPSTQHSILRSLTRTWLLLHLGGAIVDQPRPRLGVRRLEAGKIILNRTPAAVHSLAWGARVMIQCIPRRLDRLVSPLERSGIGSVLLAGAKRALPIHLHTIALESDARRFEARLEIDHGEELRAHLHLRSEADGSLWLEERLTALRDCRTARIATGLIGVLNDRSWVYERGARRVSAGERVAEIASCSGAQLDLGGSHRIAIDAALVVESEAPLRARYEAARAPQRARVTDHLYLSCLPGERAWNAGQEVGRYRVRIRPQSAAPRKGGGGVK